MSEHSEQVKVCHYLDFLRVLYFAIPNGIFLKDKQTAFRIINKQKSEGMSAGVPDLFICEANKDYHGLFIEMKTKSGVLSENQKKWIDKLNKNGYLAVCCKGFEEAREVIDNYINKQEKGVLL